MGEYHDLYLKNDTLLLAVFENFRIKNVFRNLWTRPCTISFSSRISMASSLKKTKVGLELLKDIDMLLMVKKGLEEKYSTLLIDMQKLIINIWKIMIKIKNHHI